MQLLHLAALQGLPQQLGGELCEANVLAPDEREDQRREEGQAGGTQAPRVLGEVSKARRMGCYGFRLNSYQ